ncbi:hypothetical protein K435DRAFT_806257 [Dendrothele bispora CBS 962.96]|uniref:Uncharacterized protein n=1 Tax=Dendrothele bispora (strain CBS 962.96) TaxID=1314807 RepID=A0A4S8L8G4_DENBC|nr:hypothetical protein K435DRAFT_806257 [Dendrothele bispora CBS 962.96]
MIRHTAFTQWHTAFTPLRRTRNKTGDKTETSRDGHSSRSFQGLARSAGVNDGVFEFERRKSTVICLQKEKQKDETSCKKEKAPTPGIGEMLHQVWVLRCLPTTRTTIKFPPGHLQRIYQHVSRSNADRQSMVLLYNAPEKKLLGLGGLLPMSKNEGLSLFFGAAMFAVSWYPIPSVYHLSALFLKRGRLG